MWVKYSTQPSLCCTNSLIYATVCLDNFKVTCILFCTIQNPIQNLITIKKKAQEHYKLYRRWFSNNSLVNLHFVFHAYRHVNTFFHNRSLCNFFFKYFVINVYYKVLLFLVLYIKSPHCIIISKDKQSSWSKPTEYPWAEPFDVASQNLRRDEIDKIIWYKVHRRIQTAVPYASYVTFIRSRFISPSTHVYINGHFATVPACSRGR